MCMRICKEVCTADDHVTLEVVDAAAGLLAHSLTMTNADPREEGFRANHAGSGAAGLGGAGGRAHGDNCVIV